MIKIIHYILIFATEIISEEYAPVPRLPQIKNDFHVTIILRILILLKKESFNSI